MKRLLTLLLCLALALSLAAPASAAAPALKVGVAKADITGPITEISTGYNSLGDLMEGLLTRLYARAFVIDDGRTPMVCVSAELVHMTESIKPGVLAALRADGYTMFSAENVMLTATHCHSSTSNTSWFALYDLINGVPGYDDLSYRVIVRGITEAIEAAWDSRVAGTASLVYGQTEIHASNRSADAFLANFNAGDLGYAVNADGSFSYETGLAAAQNAYNHEMAGVVLTDSSGKDLGFLNFFGSHGTSNSIDNRYVASDHKGYAALRLEQEMGGGFVAAFAQADSGDTSPNAVNEQDYHGAFLRPDEQDPTLDAIENQIVCGSQEADAALQLLRSAKRIPLTGSFAVNYTAVDFSDITVDLAYVGPYHMPYDDLSAGHVKTSEPCIGAGIIAGDEEGAPVDNAEEGAVRHQFVWNEKTQSYDRIPCDFKMIDLYGLQNLFQPLWPTAMKVLQSDAYDEAQMEKVVCLAAGELMQKAQPLQILRLGTLAIVGVPFELTFEQCNRTRSVLEQTLAPAGVQKVIFATHANAYSQYLTTREEYAAQHYEGATNLFGPWAGAALTQELDKLAEGIVSGKMADKGTALMETEPKNGLLYTTAALIDPTAELSGYGAVTSDVEKRVYTPGEWVTAAFSGVNPRHVANLTAAKDPLAEDYTYMEVQRQADGQWRTYRTDADPYTTFHCEKNSLISTGWTVTLGWLLKDESLTSGTYRLVYHGIAKEAPRPGNGFRAYKAFTAESAPFTVDAGTPEPEPTVPPAPKPTSEPMKNNPFRDVTEDAYYYDAVLWAVNHDPQITKGVSGDRFAPSDTCTRAQVVTFLWRAMGEPEPKSAENPFRDVTQDAYYAKAVRWALENGITRGTGADTFSPEEPCTRAHVVTFLWRAKGMPSARGGNPFTDVPAGQYYAEAVLWAAEQGVTKGTAAAAFSPDNPCTRGQIVTFLYRAGM